MFRLDYFSCVLTIASTILVGRRMWQGWIVAALNSIVICVIGFRTGQTGLLHANIFCIAMYLYNVMKWRTSPAQKESSVQKVFKLDFGRWSIRGLNRNFSPQLNSQTPVAHFDTILVADERDLRSRDRIRQRKLQDCARSCDPV